MNKDSRITQRHGLMSAPLCAITLGLGLTACGSRPATDSAQLKRQSVVAQTYKEWCAEWQLDCPNTEAGPDQSLSADRWQALTAIAGSALATDSVLKVSRSELDSADLQEAMQALHLGTELEDLRAQLDARHWQSGGLEKGALVFRSGAASSQTTASGLSVQFDTEQTIKFTAGTVQLSGFGIEAPASGAKAELQGLAVDADGKGRLDLSDRSVQMVPQGFVLQQLLLSLGVDRDKTETEKASAQDVVKALAPFMRWLQTDSRRIDLNRPFFATAARELGRLIPEDGFGENAGHLLNKIARLRTASPSQSNLTAIELLKGQTGRCELNDGELKFMFASEFGLKRIYAVDASTLGLEFYGVEVAAKKALGLKISLKRLELGPDALTIRDVPVIGKLEVKWDDLEKSDQKLSLSCDA